MLVVANQWQLLYLITMLTCIVKTNVKHICQKQHLELSIFAAGVVSA